MSKSVVFVEINPETSKIIRIFKNSHLALSFPQEIVKQSLRNFAVGEIRSQIVERATKEDGVHCEYCDRWLTSQTGHMHEKQFKGKGGEVSLENGVFLCYECHILGEHGDRVFQSSKIKEIQNASRNS